MTTIVGNTGLEKPRWSLAASKAEELASPYSSPPIPVLEIAEQSGVDVVLDPFDRYADTVSGFCDFALKRLYINSRDPLVRQTFTIAHELGHWILHRQFFEEHPEKYSVLPRFHNAERKNPFEQEANHFAANLLVPKRLLTPVKHASVSALAQVFAVSQVMMEYRLKNV